MAKTMAVIDNGVVINMEWCDDYTPETETQKDPGDRPVGIGDTYTDGKWYRDGTEILTPLEQAREDLQNANEQFASLQAKNEEATAAMAVFGFSTKAEAEAMRPAVEMAVQFLPDADALTVKTLYPVWEDLVKLGTVEAETGYKFTYQDDLYKCRNANPQFQETWIPGVDTAALYERIDETHSGTIDDPIPYDGNMELISGTYYTQDGVVYRCYRGTGIPVYNPLKDLVNIYVEVVA